MTIEGRIVGGTIVPDGEIGLPEGARVRVELTTLGERSAEPGVSPAGQPLGKALMRFAGRAVGLPADAATNHDHYLYGVPKK